MRKKIIGYNAWIQMEEKKNGGKNFRGNSFGSRHTKTLSSWNIKHMITFDPIKAMKGRGIGIILIALQLRLMEKQVRNVGGRRFPTLKLIEKVELSLLAMIR